MMRTLTKQQTGFTLVEMIMVIVITGIIGGIVAVFLKAPIQQYMDVARRAELTDIADTAVRRMARDVRIAVPNSIRVPDPAGVSTYVEFLPTKDGGRYRAAADPATNNQVVCGAAGDDLNFAAADTCFEIIGPTITFATGDQIVIGSTQSDGNPPYQDPTAGACNDPPTTTCIRRPIDDTNGVGPDKQEVKMTSSSALPAFAELQSQRFQVVPGSQQAVTYACVGMQGGNLDANQNGQGRLMRYWGYGFIPGPASAVPPAFTGQITAPVSAILADKVSHCEITYEVPNQRFGLLAVRLTLTSNNESVSLYNEIHVNNAP